MTLQVLSPDWQIFRYHITPILILLLLLFGPLMFIQALIMLSSPSFFFFFSLLLVLMVILILIALLTLNLPAFFTFTKFPRIYHLILISHSTPAIPVYTPPPLCVPRSRKVPSAIHSGMAANKRAKRKGQHYRLVTQRSPAVPRVSRKRVRTTHWSASVLFHTVHRHLVTPT